MQPLGPDNPLSVGPYRLLGRLGSGGMGQVYLGQGAAGGAVAVKVVYPHFAADEQFRARFQREVRAAQRVGGRWTAPVLAAAPDATVPWVATEYVPGPALGKAVSEHGPLPERSVRALGAGLAEALTAVHELGLVHRDVKPSNVLLATDGPRLIDFGIARSTDGTASLTSTGVMVGSPGYMAPEQVLGEDVTGAADVFSLGAVLTYAATGEPPFRGDASAVLLYRVVHDEPRLEGLAGELRDLVTACLAKDAAARPTPREIAARLAPDGGVAALIGPGWLPEPLDEEARRDAQLPATEPAAPGSTAAPGPTTAPGSTAAPGVSHLSTASGGAGRPGAYDPGAVPGHVPTEHDSGTGPDGYRSGPGQDGYRFDSGPDGWGPTPPPGRRGRRLLPALAAVVVLAAIAVPVGYGWLHNGGGGKPGGGGRSPSADPTGSTSAGPAAGQHAGRSSGPTRDGGSVPDAFLGTWKGSASASTGLDYENATVVLTGGKKGASVGKTTYRLALVGDSYGGCFSDDELISASDRKLTLEEVPDPHKHQAFDCIPGNAKTTLTMLGKNTLQLESDAGGQHNSGKLTRSSG